MAVDTGQMPPDLLPREVTSDIFTKASEQSAVMRLARQVTLPVAGETAIPVTLDVPTAGWVNEGQRKPVSDTGIQVQMMRGKKIAVIVPVSQELLSTNPGGVVSQMQRDLPTAIARGFDYAAVHGQTLQGEAGPFPNYLAQATHQITLGTASQASGGIWGDVVAGESAIVDAGYDFSGFAADPRFGPTLKTSVDSTGRPIFVQDLSTQGIAGGGMLDGFPLWYGRGVGGKLNRQSSTQDTGLRAVGGDFGMCAYGVGMDITLRQSDEASYVDGDGNLHSAFQENLRLYLAEAYYGFVMASPDAFVNYVSGSGGSGGGGGGEE